MEAKDNDLKNIYCHNISLTEQVEKLVYLCDIFSLDDNIIKFKYAEYSFTEFPHLSYLFQNV